MQHNEKLALYIQPIIFIFCVCTECIEKRDEDSVDGHNWTMDGKLYIVLAKN